MHELGHVDELLPAFALGALEHDEAAQVAAHLEGCPRCRGELTAYLDLVGGLAYAAPAGSPPAGLRGKILAGVQPARLTWPQRARGLLQRTAPIWAAAGLVLLVALLVSNLLLWRQVRQAAQVPAAGFVTVAMTGAGPAPHAAGLMVVSHDGRYGTLVVDGLPALSADRVYQLWLIADGQRTSGGLLRVGQDGYGALWISAPQPLLDYQSFGVTIEPEGGSPGPTGEKVLGGGL